MLRGSKPGERRGGRKRETPNRRTILAERILAIGSDHPTASRREFLLILVKDRELPADTRIAVAPKCFPAKRAQTGGTPRHRISAGVRSRIEQGAFGKAGADEARQDLNPQALD